MIMSPPTHLPGSECSADYTGQLVPTLHGGNKVSVSKIFKYMCMYLENLFSTKTQLKSYHYILNNILLWRIPHIVLSAICERAKSANDLLFTLADFSSVYPYTLK